MKCIVDTLDNITFGENGAAAVKNLDDSRLEIFSKQLTRGSKPILKTKLSSSSAEDFVYDIILTHYARSPMNGAGERDIFYDMFLQLVDEIPSVMVKILPFVVDPRTGGSWKDICRLAEEIDKSSARSLPRSMFLANLLDFYAGQLITDFDNLLEDETTSVTLAAKYAPSEGKRFWKIFGKDLAIRIWIIKNGTPPSKSVDAFVNYRRMMSFLRKRIGIVESLMCAGKWSSINFGKVPSIAMQKLGRYAFPNIDISSGKRRSDLSDRIECAVRFDSYKVDVSDGKETIHGSTIGLDSYGREFEESYRNHDQNRIDLVNLQFGNLITKLRETIDTLDGNFDITSMIPVVDVSGSMSQRIGNNVTCMQIAIQMGMIFSELCPKSDFYQRLLTFSMNPEWINTSDCDSYSNKFMRIKGSNWGMNTNFVSTFRLILEVAKSKKISPETFNKFKMIVFSDMQFDCASNETLGSRWSTTHETLRSEFSEAGYEVPGIIYWNLAARSTDGFVVNDSEPGVVMVSGFGTGQLKQILAGNLKESTPIQKMYEVLEAPAFADLRETAMKSLMEIYELK